MIPALAIVHGLSLALCVGVQPARVFTWSDEPSMTGMTGEIVKADAQGVHLRVESSPIPTVIAWYRVRQIEPPPPQPGAFSRIAEDAWRAHTRLARGDHAGALRVYESMRDAYLWQIGPQSMDVAIGLKRCLLNRGQRLRAIEPAVAWYVSAGADAGKAAQDFSDIDPRMMLHIDLPPIAGSGPRTGLPFALPQLPNLTDRERLLFLYYRLVSDGPDRAEAHLTQIEDLKRLMRSRDPGLVLMEQMVFAQAHPDAAKRNAGFNALRRRTKTQADTWVEVWARLAMGASLLSDPDATRREQGVIELLHVVVRLHSVDPNLTMLAAQTAAAYLDATERGHLSAQILHDARTKITEAMASPTRGRE
mgnify:CR=1 FL=1